MAQSAPIVRDLRVNADEDLTFGTRWKLGGVPYVLSAARLVIATAEGGTVLLDCTTANSKITLTGDGWARVYVAKSAIAAIAWPTTAGRWHFTATRTVDGHTVRLYEGGVVFSGGFA